VALDDNCDGTADGPFGESVTQDAGECVVYEICVTNTAADQTLENVVLNDADIGIVDFPVEDLSPGETQCFFVASEIPAADCEGDICICENVIGTNTVEVSAICGFTGADACLEPGSNCDDTATVDCVSEAICRTPGFWGTHAGTEKKGSQDITQAVITACGGSLEICGECINDTVPINNAASAVEAMCVNVKGAKRLQLARLDSRGPELLHKWFRQRLYRTRHMG
jgi:hypothetical protein